MTAYWGCLEWLFWGSAGLALFNHLGLTPLLKLLSPRGKGWQGDAQSAPPTVTVIIPAYNEDAVIAARIENLLQQDYPKDSLEVIVASDMSTDGTDAVVKGFESQGIKLMRMTARSGKLGILDTVVPRANGEIVVITDANVSFASDALFHIVQPFSDPRVGCVGGDLRLVAPEGGVNIDREMSYRARETDLKLALGKMGRLIGVYGGFYALRRVAFTPIGGRPVHDDVILPMEAAAKGFRVVFQPLARAVEETRATIGGEYRRRVRMAAYNLSSIPRTVSAAFRAGLGMMLLTVAYKMLRWLAPFLLALASAALFALAFRSGIYQIIAGFTAAGIGAALLGGALNRFGRRLFPFTGLWHFLVMNVASYGGLLLLARGLKLHWTPAGGIGD